MDRHRTRRLETAALIIALMLFIPTIASALPAPLTIRPAPLPARHTAFTTARPVLQLRSGQTTMPKPARPRTPKRTIERAVAPVTAAPTTATVAVAPAPAPAPVSGSPDWNAIAACESGGNWAANTGNGYWGGLQFHPNTWFAYGGGPFDGSGPFPYSAGQQIAVAEGVYAGQGPGAWPSCFQYA